MEVTFQTYLLNKNYPGTVFEKILKQEFKIVYLSTPFSMRFKQKYLTSTALEFIKTLK